jgi:hypothetical protein
MRRSLRSHLWVVEERASMPWAARNGSMGWTFCADRARATRERARVLARFVRDEDLFKQTRVRQYARVEGSR